jgi:short-subunit dehydrogenase
LSKKKFVDKNIFITGASSGIGYALAFELAKQGANLIVAARRTDRLQKLVTLIKENDGKALAIKADVRHAEEVNAAIVKAEKKFGTLDVIVANAAIPMHGNFDELSTDNFRQIFETNVFGVLNTTYAGLDTLKKSQGGLVIIGSVMAYMATPGTSAYSMAKFAIRAFAETLYNELGKFGVKVILINPGFVKSEIRQVDNRGLYDPNRKDWVPSFMVMNADNAAKKIAKAIYKGKREKFIGIYGYMGYWFRQYTPWLYFTLLTTGNRIMRKAGKDQNH